MLEIRWTPNPLRLRSLLKDGHVETETWGGRDTGRISNDDEDKRLERYICKSRSNRECAGLGQGVITMKESFSSGFRVSMALLIPPLKWRRKWQPTPVFLPGESHGQWSLAGYSPWSRKESDMTEWLHFHFHLNGATLSIKSTCFTVCNSAPSKTQF